jgi:hypothetical protein
VTARAQLAQAEARFKELDDEGALARLTEVSTRLVPVHQAEGATALLAEAHLQAAAIYLARGQLEAVQVRLQRALDLVPDLVAPRHRFDPRLQAELAAAREAQALRATGRLEITAPPEGPGGQVFLDGHPVGRPRPWCWTRSRRGATSSGSAPRATRASSCRWRSRPPTPGSWRPAWPPTPSNTCWPASAPRPPRPSPSSSAGPGWSTPWWRSWCWPQP